MHTCETIGRYDFFHEVWKPFEHSELVRDAGISGSSAGGAGPVVQDAGCGTNKKVAGGSGRSGEMAFSGYGNDRISRRNGNVRVFDRNRVVGFGRIAARTVHDARFFRGTFGATGIGGAHCGASGAGDIQWKNV